VTQSERPFICNPRGFYINEAIQLTTTRVAQVALSRLALQASISVSRTYRAIVVRRGARVQENYGGTPLALGILVGVDIRNEGAEFNVSKLWFNHHMRIACWVRITL
jgi:hypothetical protein